MYHPDELLQKVNAFIDQLPYDRQPVSLYEPIRYVLSLGGKRIRPVLMMLAYNLYREDPERILMPAVAIETYHNFTLLHDDLMDNADVRRGQQTVHPAGMPIRPSSLVTPCWCWLLSVCSSVMYAIFLRLSACLPRQRLKLMKARSLIWLSRRAMMLPRKSILR